MKLISSKSTRFYLPAVITVLVDQVSKYIARTALPANGAITVIPGVFDLRLSYNSGAAFGMFSNQAPLFIIVALVAIFAIVKLRNAGPDSGTLSVGLGLLLGGAVGNLIDRIFSRAHEVTDFLSLHISIGGQTRFWPTFNVADIAVVTGALLVFYYVYIIEKRKQDA
ncbi:signal peptidase II [bacterium]|nr:signal peptidase II [bacterium]